MKNFCFKKLNHCYLAVILLAFLIPQNASGALSDDLNIKISPATPRPGELIEATLESFSTDLNQAEITWRIDGVTIKKGKGETRLETNAALAGKSTEIYVRADTLDSGVIEKILVIRPGRVDLLFEASSYTPPFYKGRALVPSESIVKAVAVPNFITSSGRHLKAGEIIFTWKKNGMVIGNASGVGKDILTFKSGRIPGDEPLIEVEVSAPEENFGARTGARAPIIFPRIVFYEEQPLRGVVFNRALEDAINLSGNEMRIIAYPYYMEGKNLEEGTLSYHWYMNRGVIPGGDRINTMTVRAPEKSGSAILSLNVSNMAKLFEGATKNLFIEFGRN